MTPERWKQIEEIFDSALEREAGERAAFLDEACGGDAELRQEVESLLAHQERAGTVIQAAVQGEAHELAGARNIPDGPQQIGPYKIIREIGRGGMGGVYLAARADDQYRKRVAIKLIRRGMDTEDILRRFRNERQILASLDHPNIARLLDGGTTAEGLPYFVMEYIEGKSINDYCDTHKLSTLERLKLFRTVCAAVHFAHQNLVVHRDLKPSNIVVTSDGVTKLLDFGIAKLLNPELSGQTIAPTATAVRLMTPEYASPEQVRGDAITTSSDVYSLGVLLYELLTGHRPYRVRNRAPQEIVHAICEVEPEKPSTIVNRSEEVPSADGRTHITLTPESVSRTREGQPDKLSRRLSGDLDNIVLMAMRKEPQRRYTSVAQFSEDIRRHLEGLPVIARRDTFSYRAGKFVKRNKVAVAVSLVIALLLFGFVANTVVQSRRVSRERDAAARSRDRAEIERQKAGKVSEFLTEIFRGANPSVAKGKDLTARELLDKGAERVRNELRDQPEVQAKLLLTISDAYGALGLYDRAEPLAQEAFAVNLRTLGKEHPQTLLNLERLADLKFWRGEHAEAERLRRELYETYRRLYGDDLRTATNLLWLAGAWANQGKKSEYEEGAREAVAMARRILPAEDSRLTLFLNTEAQLYWNRQDYEHAEPLFREVLRIEQKKETQDPFAAATAYSNLGRMLMSKGDLDQAEPYLRHTEKLRRDNIKGENFIIGLAMFNVGDCLFQKGKYDEAEQTLRRVIEICRAGTETARRKWRTRFIC